MSMRCRRAAGRGYNRIAPLTKRSYNNNATGSAYEVTGITGTYTECSI
jgi:hypothetical protein